MELSFYDDEDDFVVRRPRGVRERAEDFDNLDDVDFVTRFRLTKPTVLTVPESIEDKIEYPTQRTCKYLPTYKNVGW